ncbi:MAG: ABC transporter permease [Planctomycetota bacterium]|jgi:ABC-type transport system involved in multi-copper enzyme maturation permease subunit
MRSILNDILLAIWRLVPANPIVVRVVQGGSKRIQHMWARVGYLMVLFFVMLIMQLSLGSSRGSLATMAKTSTQIFEFISILQLALMCFLAPVFTAGAITQEKDADTFNVLLTTPLTNAQIVLGSLLSRLFFVIMLLVAGLPIFCITMLFGGVTGEQIFNSFGIAGSTAVLTGSLAIMISIIRIGTRGTIFSFYLGIALFLGAGLALGMWSATYVPESIVPGTNRGMTWLAPFHPFWALWVALNQVQPPHPGTVQHYGWPLNSMLASPHTAYMVVTLILSLMMVTLTTLFVRQGAKQGELTFWSKLITRWFRTNVNKNGEDKRRPRHVWSNPVAWREATTRASAASSNMVRYSYLAAGITAGLILFITYVTDQFVTVANARNWLTGIVMIEFVTVMLMAANTAATAITREREAGTMELLLSTPLTSRYIIWGKLRGLVSFTLPLLAVPAATVVLMALYDFFSGTKTPVVHLGSAILLPPLLLVYSAFACMLGLHMSLKNKHSVQSVLACIGILVAVAFGLSLCAFSAVKGQNHIGALMAPMTFVTSVWMVLNPDLIIKAGAAGRTISPAEIQVFMFFGTLIALGIYGAIAIGTYRSMLTNFDMIVRKQSQ